jgi:hypothetical protein
VNMKNVLAVFLAVAVGFAVGLAFSRQTPVMAQSSVKVAYKEIISPYAGTDIPGTKIVGFSCVPHEGSSSPDCYVAYIP